MKPLKLFLSPTYKLLPQIEQRLYKELGDIPIKVAATNKKWVSEFESHKYWINPNGRMNLLIPEEFSSTADKYELIPRILKSFQNLLLNYIEEFAQINNYMRSYKEGTRPIADFSIFIDISNKCRLVYVYDDLKSKEDLIERMDKTWSFIYEYYEGNSRLIDQIKKIHKVDGKTTFLVYDTNLENWTVLNLLFKLGEETMKSVATNHDQRFAKPDMFIRSNNLRKVHSLPDNWKIRNKKRGYIINRPNDIGVYSSIANKALERAHSKFKELHKDKITELIISEETVSRFYDYFEEIIQALIMSYTTIECMANVCIPDRYIYTFTDKKGDIKSFDKLDIERRISLKDKLSDIIPDALKISSPKNEKWWSTLIELEVLRNEIIHTKYSKAEDRYSKYIDERVFETANVHNVIVQYYAKELCSKQSRLMNDFPVGFGCDTIIPGLMKPKNFNDLEKILYNPGM